MKISLPAEVTEAITIGILANERKLLLEEIMRLSSPGCDCTSLVWFEDLKDTLDAFSTVDKTLRYFTTEEQYQALTV